MVGQKLRLVYLHLGDLHPDASLQALETPKPVIALDPRQSGVHAYHIQPPDLFLLTDIWLISRHNVSKHWGYNRYSGWTRMAK